MCSIGFKTAVSATQTSGAPVVDINGAQPKPVGLDFYGATVLANLIDSFTFTTSFSSSNPVTSSFYWSDLGSPYSAVDSGAVIDSLTLSAQPASTFTFIITASYGARQFSISFAFNTLDCEAGTYRELSTTDGSLYTCIDCAPGSYTSAAERYYCTVCAANTFCVGKSSAQIPCPSLYTSSSGSAFCVCDSPNLVKLSGVSGCKDLAGNPSSTSDCPTIGGNLLAISGANFGTGATFISVGGTACVPIRYEMTYPEVTNGTTCEAPTGHVECYLPEGAGQLQFVTVSDTTGSASERLLSYASPVVEAVSGCDDDGLTTVNCPRDGNGTYITVTGTNFGPSAAQVLVGGVLAEIGEMKNTTSTHTTTVARLPPGSGTQVTINAIQKNGEVSSGAKLLSFVTCGAGNYNLFSTLSGFSCEPCADGYFNTDSESYSCGACPVGFYCSSTKSSSCNAEIPGSSSLTASHLVANCTCPFTQVLVPAETNQNTSKCFDCPRGFICEREGETVAGVTLRAGYWRTNELSMDTRECKFPAACVQAQGGGDDLCAEGHRGRYCAVCAAGFTASYNGACKVCKSGAGAWPLAIASLIAIICASLFLLRSNNKNGRGRSDASGAENDDKEENDPIDRAIDSVNDVQTGARRSVLSSNMEKRAGSLAVPTSSISISGSTSHLSAVFKILVTFTQIVGSMPSVFLVQFPPSFARLLGMISLVSLSFLKAFSLDCIQTSINFHNELLFTTLAPLVIAAIIILVAVVRRRVAIREATLQTEAKKAEADQNCVRALLILSYLVLPGVSTTIFRTFPCESFDDSTAWLRVDYSIDCESSSHKAFVSYAAVMVLIYPVGVPCLYCYMLWRNRNLLCPAHLDQNGKPVPLEEQVKKQHENMDGRGLDFLFRSYTPRAYWFELFETARRLALTGFLVLIMPGSASQLSLAIMVMVLSIALVCRYTPFVDKETGSLNFIAQVQTFLSLYAALLIQSKSTSKDGWGDNSLSLFLIFVVLSVFVMGAYTTYRAGSGTVKKALDSLSPTRRKLLAKTPMHTPPPSAQEQSHFFPSPKPQEL